MAESLITKSRLMGKITLGALGAGCFDTSDGSVLTGGETYEVKFEQGDMSCSVAGRTQGPLLDRGDIVSVLSGDEQPTTIQFTAYLRDLGDDAGVSTLSDIGLWLARDPGAMSSYADYVAQNWESVYASSAGAGDAGLNGLSVKFEITNPGDSSDTHMLIANKCFGSVSYSEGDPDTISISLTCTDGGLGDPTPVIIG